MDQVEHDTQFNNFCSILAAEGTPYPQNLGGNCVFLAGELAKRLADAGYEDVWFLQEQGGKHHGVVCQEDGKWYYLDPFLLMQEPFCLTDAADDRESVSIKAFPNVAGQGTQIVFTPFSDRYFSLEVFHFREEVRKHVFMGRAYCDLRERKKHLPPDGDLSIAYSVVDKLLLRHLGEDGRTSALTYDLHNFFGEKMCVGYQGEAKISKRWFLNAQFDLELARLALAVNVSVEEIFSTLRTAKEHYLRRNRYALLT